LPEKPGSYKKFLSLIGSRNITEFNYRFNDPAEAHVFVGVQVAQPDRVAEAGRACANTAMPRSI
jgi:hypothetical protein